MKEYLEFDNLKIFKGLKHLFTQKDTTRDLDFSLALHTGDEVELVLRNRAEIEKLFDRDSSFISLLQTHSDRVFVVREKESFGWRELDDSIRADALITNLKGVVLTILTADCVPIFIYDPKREAIGLVHSGWRGTKQNIIKNTLEAMSKEYESSGEDLIVAVAPSIRSCCYEVGSEVANEFLDYPKALSKKGERYYLDVASICKEQLISLGVKEKNIERNPICTSCQSERFFSYRKDKTRGRFMSLIGLI